MDHIGRNTLDSDAPKEIISQIVYSFVDVYRFLCLFWGVRLRMQVLTNLKTQIMSSLFCVLFCEILSFPGKMLPYITFTNQGKMKDPGRFEDSAPASSDTKSACSCPGNASLNGVS